MLMMLPFEAPTVFEGIHKSYFRMPRVVKDQRSKFEKDDLFRQLSHESQVKYTGFKDRPLEERQMKFITNCQEGHTEVSVVQSGNQFTLMFNPTAHPAYNNEGCDFDKELGKVHIKSGFILNGVCVLWRGWLDLQRLEGFGCLEFDEYRAYLEEAMLKQQIDKQQAACNSALGGAGSTATNQTSPLNHHPSLNASAAGPPAVHPSHLTGSLGGLMAHQPLRSGGHLSPSCLQAASQAGLQHLAHPLPPPGALGPLVDSATAAQYGNAAIAAATAAFQQAFGVMGPTNHPGLHGLTGPPPAAAVAAAAAAVATGQPPLIAASQHLGAYTNGHSTNPHATSLGSPKHMSNGNTAPIKEHHHQRQATKRSLQDDQTHLDEVDVVSDIDLHQSDLDFPPRRMFKADPLVSVPLHHHHHHHHHNSNHPNHQLHHHRATRRA